MFVLPDVLITVWLVIMLISVPFVMKDIQLMLKVYVYHVCLTVEDVLVKLMLYV